MVHRRRNRYKRSSPDRWYIDPEELRMSVKEMREQGHLTERFARNMIVIFERIMRMPKYRMFSEEFRQELWQYNAYRWSSTGWKTIQPDKNCFAYVSSACILNCVSLIKRVKREQQILREIENDSTYSDIVLSAD